MATVSTAARLGTGSEAEDLGADGFNECPDCRAGLEHCHGTAIIELDGVVFCSDDPDCRLGTALHRFCLEAEDA